MRTLDAIDHIPGKSEREQVVLVPCSAGSTRQYKALVEQLGAFESVAIDLCGHGNRQRWHGAGPLSLCEEAAAIGTACSWDAPFHLVGHSYGGAVALRFALTFPERLRSLTLYEPSCFHLLKTGDDGDARLLGEIRAVAEAVNRGVISGDYRAGMETFIDYWAGAGSWKSLGEDRKAAFAALAVPVAHHFWSLIEEPTPLDAYAGVDVPTLILCGDRSPGPSRAVTRLLAAALPRARHRTVREAGHMAPVTQAGEVNPLILEHLRANASRMVLRRPTQVAGHPIAERSSAEHWEM
ncbi:MAG: alpha/beta hydrolase [Alphaproteobacteria bacterium]|nr:alpha/beta hydrolase [Alphaproteobacteria bacterium]